MSEGIPCRQLTSLSPSRRLRDFVLWHPSRESHQQTHIKPCDVRIRFSACGSGAPGPIRSHHFMDSSWLRYQIPNDHCTTKTIDCVFDHHSLISSPNVFKTEFPWRHNIKLATRLWTSVSNTISSTPSPKKKTFLEHQNVLFLLIFQQKCMHNERLFYDNNIINNKKDLQRWGPSLLEGGNSVTTVLYSALLSTQPYCLLRPSVVQGPIYEPSSLIHSSLNLLFSLYIPI